MMASHGLFAVVLFATAVHIDAFAPTPALWRSGTAPLRSAASQSSRIARGPKMAISEQETATEVQAKKDAEAAMKAAILERRRAESKEAGDPSGQSTTKPSVKPIDLLTKWSWGMQNAVSPPPGTPTSNGIDRAGDRICPWKPLRTLLPTLFGRKGASLVWKA